ncbi:hypothetical protein KSP40_PGU000087 [Platanthera guangdongensis]|uniref:Uncharacterized protein n=1 Tax=Platanthera guangdongensis TaxID=2320717 RepID=A0ABR2M046_9ASPA
MDKTTHMGRSPYSNTKPEKHLARSPRRRYSITPPPRRENQHTTAATTCADSRASWDETDGLGGAPEPPQIVNNASTIPVVNGFAFVFNWLVALGPREPGVGKIDVEAFCRAVDGQLSPASYRTSGGQLTDINNFASDATSARGFFLPESGLTPRKMKGSGATFKVWYHVDHMSSYELVGPGLDPGRLAVPAGSHGMGLDRYKNGSSFINQIISPLTMKYEFPRPSLLIITPISKANIIGPKSWVEGQIYCNLGENLSGPWQQDHSATGGPKGAIPNPSPFLQATTRSHHGCSSSSPPTADGFRTGTPVPIPQSQSFSRSYGSILSTSLAYIIPSTRGCSPWRPDAVLSMIGHGRDSILRISTGRLGHTGHR